MYHLNNDDGVFSGFSLAAGAKPAAVPDEGIYEAAIADLAESQLRSEAMGIALTFVADGDYSPEYLEAMLMGFVDEDEDDDLSESETLHYEALAESLAEAFTALGASKDNARSAIAGDEEAAETLGDYLAGKLEDNPKSDDEIVAKFAVEGGMVLEAKKRVIRDGKVTWIKVPTRKRRLSAAQRAALKKARMKANTSAAKRARGKAMRQRKQRGM